MDSSSQPDNNDEEMGGAMLPPPSPRPSSSLLPQRPTRTPVPPPPPGQSISPEERIPPPEPVVAKGDLQALLFKAYNTGTKLWERPQLALLEYDLSISTGGRDATLRSYVPDFWNMAIPIPDQHEVSVMIVFHGLLDLVDRPTTLIRTLRSGRPTRRPNVYPLTLAVNPRESLSDPRCIPAQNQYWNLCKQDWDNGGHPETLNKTHNKSIPLFSQETSYTPACKEIVKEQGFLPIGQQGAAGFIRVDSRSVVFAPASLRDTVTKEIIADLAKPAAMIWTTIQDPRMQIMEEPGQPEYYLMHGDSPRVYQLSNGYDKCEFPPSDFLGDLSIYVNADPSPSDFSQSTDDFAVISAEECPSPKSPRGKLPDGPDSAPDDDDDVGGGGALRDSVEGDDLDDLDDIDVEIFDMDDIDAEISDIEE
ncbi:hypothetical protein F4861DRAFT_541783 [Xylaria intraflava]|nr:hypothetical protein F4861DRAFT_541783 [Xylaria intraflava]